MAAKGYQCCAAGAFGHAGVCTWSKQTRLAGLALTAAVAGDWPKASRVVQRISDECGWDGVGEAVQRWIDHFAFTSGAQLGAQFAPAWLNGQTGQIDGADDVPPHVRWAGHLMMARINDDPEMFAALGAVLQGLTDSDVGLHIGTVLELCAYGLRRVNTGQPVVLRSNGTRR